MTEENKSVKKFPNLRFQGFENEWEQITLGNCAYSFEYGMNASAIKFDGQNKYIRITDIDESSSKYKPDFPVSPNGQLLDKYLVSENDILFARTGASTGKSYLYHKDDGKLYFAGFLIRAKIKEEFNSYFVFIQTKTIQYYKWVQLMSMRSGQPGINSQEYASYSFNIPSKNEQNKIASFLSLIDERILSQKKIISQLKSQMSNLKDLLFEQQLRFTDDKGNEFADWQENKLEDICEKQSSSISANKIEDNIGDYPIYGATGILKNVDFYEVENDYVSIVKDGAGVGRLLYCKGKSSVLGTLDIIQSKNINLYFIFLLLSRIDFKKYITGSTIPHIYFKDYKKEKFQIPSIEEQEKIANFFKSLDAKINLETELLTQYENQKKHLLQNLFI